MNRIGKIKQALSKTRSTTLPRQLRVLLVGVIVPCVAVAVISLATLGALNHEYEVTLHNATTASEFNIDFKKQLDLDMYYFVVQSSNIDHLPVEEVDNAQDIIDRLKATTTQKENRWRLKSMHNLCVRLRECMLEIQDTKQYDIRMQRLENDIYIITKLIDTYMHEYLYDEVDALSTLQQDISRRAQQNIIVLACTGAALAGTMLLYSVHIARGIARPVTALCGKVERLGTGDFTVEPIETRNIELRTLDEGFNKMVGQINALLQHVKDDQTALRRAEFELLQSQINPHFLYNTFDSIIWLAETHQDELVVQITTDLSDFFRYSLAKGKDIITLETEKQQVESYLKIQQVRYGDILDYEVDIPQELLRYRIPKLTLQPLAENALYHGIKNKRGGGKITIAAREYGAEIRIKVSDNGAGMTQDSLAALCAGVYENEHAGVGLVNVHKRLRLYCGDRYGLAFESTPGVGTTVTVRLPK